MSTVNEGQRKLVSTGLSLSKLAKLIGVSRPTVLKWKNAESLPLLKHRITIEGVLCIDREDWDRPLGPGETIPRVINGRTGRPKKGQEDTTEGPVRASKGIAGHHIHTDNPEAYAPGESLQRTPAVPPYPEAPESPTTLEAIRHSLRCIQHDLRWREYTSTARSKVRADETRALALIAKLEATEELKESNYVHSHPAWKKLRERILGALEKHPEAAKDVLEAMRAL